MTLSNSRKALSADVPGISAAVEPVEQPGSEARAPQRIERFNQTVLDRLRVERDTVIGCSNELEHAAATGQRITLVAACVTTRLCPNATEEVPSPPQPSYCPDYKAKIRDTIQNATRPEATYEEAAAAADVWAREGIDALVARVPEVYRHNKQLYDDGHETTNTVVNRLLMFADIRMEDPIEVISNKSYTPANGDKRTYVSLATYCWPSNPDDLENPVGPWECKDGLPFPGRNIIAPDFEKLMRMQHKVLALSAAYYYSRDEKYAAHAAANLRAFYLDPETGMLPSLMYAQLRGGSKVGATTGTIDNHATYLIFDSVALLAGSESWTRDDQAALFLWFSKYIHHLQSDHCRSESLQENNHGTFFDVQYLSIVSFLRRKDDAVAFINNVVKPRMRAQIAGSVMATEMTRPKSYSYHSFILEGYVQLAMMSEKFGINLWDMSAESGNSILDAWDWMVPHWCDRSESIWPVEQIDNPKLDLNRPQEFVAAVYTHVMKSVEVADAYTLRGRHYALLYQSMRGGPDPKHEMDEARALIRQLGFVRFDDCFITFCPEREVLQVDAPTYPADNCIPALGTPLGLLDATKGPLRDVEVASDILPALLKGDAADATLDLGAWLGQRAATHAAQLRSMAGTHIAAHRPIGLGVVLVLLAVVSAAAVRAVVRAVRRKVRVG